MEFNFFAKNLSFYVDLTIDSYTVSQFLTAELIYSPSLPFFDIGDVGQSGNDRVISSLLLDRGY